MERQHCVLSHPIVEYAIGERRAPFGLRKPTSPIQYNIIFKKWEIFVMKYFIKLVLISYRIVLGKCDQKYSITFLLIFNIEGGTEAET